MKFFNFKFNRQKFEHENITASETVKEKIIFAIKICEENLHIEENKIYEFENRAKELIADIYTVPSKYWYDELNSYSEIKKHNENKNIDKTVLDKTENLIIDYIEQIKLCNSKINFLNSLLLKYETLLKKVENTVKKTLMLKSNETYIKSLKKYREKLDEVSDSGSEIEHIYEESEHLKTIRDEINGIEEDFLIQKEVNEYINKITSEFYKDTENNNTESIREEISKLNNEINNIDNDKN